MAMEEDKKEIGTQEADGEKAVKVESEDIDSLKEELEAKKKALSELQDKYIRLYAEFENYKKVSTKEYTELLRYSHERIVSEILPVIDSLERAINYSKGPEGNLQGITEGVEMTLKLMMDTFERFGLKPIKALGEVFDPSKHHAVSQVESEEHNSNMVVEELMKGYCLNDRVLRPSMVVVTKRPEREDVEKPIEILE